VSDLRQLGRSLVCIRGGREHQHHENCQLE
jgi:hypothetical protein